MGAHARRLAAFADALAGAGQAAALVSHPRGLFYLTGTAQPANLLVVPGAPPTLFARRFGDLVRREAAVERVLDGAGFGAVRHELERLGAAGGPVGMELDVVPASLYLKAREAFGEIADCAPLLLALRARKDPDEVAALGAAADLFEAVHEAIVAHLRPGIAEHELAGEVQRALRRAGHDGVIGQRRWDAALQPEGALASGEHLATISGGPVTVSGVGLSRAVPFGASARRIEDGDLVNIDLGLRRAGYHADMARTYVLGEPPDDVAELGRVVRRLEDACIAAVRPGALASEVYDAGVAHARDEGVEDVFQGYGDTRGPYVGHAIGLELDESPVLGPGVGVALEEGMVLAIEPKLISPAFGAVNLEDDVVVTAGGCELLRERVPRALLVCDGRGGVTWEA